MPRGYFLKKMIKFDFLTLFGRQQSIVLPVIFIHGLLSFLPNLVVGHSCISGLLYDPHILVGFNGVPRGSVVKCLTRNPRVLGLSRTVSPGCFSGSVLGKDTSEPCLVLVKPRKDMNNVSCRCDMTEILLKAA